MQAYLLINTIFKTIEYKLVNSDSLKVTELSMYAEKSKKVLLNSINIEHGQSVPSFISWLILFLGCSVTLLVSYFSQYSSLLQNNLMNVIFFLVSITLALTLICRPTKTIKYRDVYSNNVLLKLSQNSMINNAQNEFVYDLNEAIEKAKAEESNKINLKKNVQLQYEVHNKNVDELFNLGLIDEALYNRVCSSMHEKVFGGIKQHVMTNNVIYLNR